MIKEFQKEYRWLSNFAPCAIMFEGEKYDSVEHAYQAAKALNPAERKWFQSALGLTAGKAKGLGRKIKVREDWEDIKIETMRILLAQKFSTTKYKKLLKGTGDLHIQEGNMWNDKFWGICLKTEEGQNNLGKMIMEIRDIINKLEA